MKNYFRLEVFKDGAVVFDKQVPTLMFSQVITQWTAPDLGYSVKVTLDSGVEINSDQWLNSDTFVREAFTQSIDHVINQEKVNLDAEITAIPKTPL
jgi:hypothetical protein